MAKLLSQILQLQNQKRRNQKSPRNLKNQKRVKNQKKAKMKILRVHEDLKDQVLAELIL